MKYMRVKSAFLYPDGEVKNGAILAVEDAPSENGIVFILEGKSANRSVHISHLEDIDLGQLVEDLRIAQEDELRAVAGADRLTNENIMLHRENKRLMDEVDAARESKKVVLPKEVAEALDSLKKDGDEERIMRVIASGYGIMCNPTDRLRTVLEYAKSNGFALIAALANGYTVEKTKEERLREGIREIYDNFDISNEEVINRIADFVTKFNAEN